MPADPLSFAGLLGLVFVAALLYSIVGHGGASGYIAAMTLFGLAPSEVKPAALVMNLAVAGIGTVRFASERLVPWRLLGPFLVGSVPAAWLGGRVALPTGPAKAVLGGVLLFAAFRLWLSPWLSGPRRAPPPAAVRVLLGAGLGFVSGLTGVGGGIFLSPLLLLLGWEEMRRVSGASAAFILANSASGLLGQLQSGAGLPEGLPWLVAVAVVGGLLGSWLGAKRLPVRVLGIVLGAVLALASAKLLLG